MEYDEIRITTRREIAICEQAIKKIKRELAAVEKKHGISNEVFLDSYSQQVVSPDSEMSRWYEMCSALERWKERLAEHRRIMLM